MPGTGTGCSLVLLLGERQSEIISAARLWLVSCSRVWNQSRKPVKSVFEDPCLAEQGAWPPDLVSLPRCVSFQNAKALKAKKEDGNKAFKKGNYKLAYELYTEALGIDPNNIKTNAKLYCNRGTVNSKVRGVLWLVSVSKSLTMAVRNHRWVILESTGSPGCWAAASLRPWAVFQGFVLAQHLEQFPTAETTPAETKLKYLGCMEWEGEEGRASALS